MITIKRFYSTLIALVFCGLTASADAAVESVLTQLKKTDGVTRILLAEPDIELQQIITVGTPETRADWSEKAEKNVNYWLNQVFNKDTIRLIPVKLIPGSENFHQQRQLLLLTQAVNTEILRNQLSTRLPTKPTFQWTIGDNAQALADTTDANYLLTIYMRRGYTTAGRAAFATTMAILGALAGQVVVPQTHYSSSYASLVDLSDGRVVWFNLVRGDNGGDLRVLEQTLPTLESLLAPIPGIKVYDF